MEQDLMNEKVGRSRDELKGYAEGLMDAIYIAPNWQSSEWAARRLVLLANLDITQFDYYWDSSLMSMISYFVGTAFKALTGEKTEDFPILERPTGFVDPKMNAKEWRKKFNWTY